MVEGKACPDVYCKPIDYKPEPKPGQLSESQLKQFYEEGYLVLHDVFDKEILEKAKESIGKKCDLVIDQLYKAGKISQKYENEGFFTRMIKVNKEFPGASVLVHTRGSMPEGVQDVWCYPKLLNIVEQLVGPDIIGHVIWNIRVKLPRNETEEVPWHQDNGYFDPIALGTLIPTAWIPLLDTSPNNGGMQVIKCTQKPGITGKHNCCAGATWYIEMEEEEIKKSFFENIEENTISLNVPYGGLLLFSNALIHRSVSNVSTNIRWALDLRYQNPKWPTGRPETSDMMPLMMKDGKIVENIDWSGIHRRQEKDIKKMSGENEPVDPFDTRIAGPWMKRWPIKHHNKHTALFQETGRN